MPATASKLARTTPAASLRRPLESPQRVRERLAFSAACADADALLVQELLAQDVRVPAVLSEFAQHVEVHPPQRERAAAVAVDHVVQPQG